MGHAVAAIRDKRPQQAGVEGLGFRVKGSRPTKKRCFAGLKGSCFGDFEGLVQGFASDACQAYGDYIRVSSRFCSIHGRSSIGPPRYPGLGPSRAGMVTARTLQYAEGLGSGFVGFPLFFGVS